MPKGENMQDKQCRRGYVPTDRKEFSEQIGMLRKAARDTVYLLEAGYPLKSASVFVGNHYLLTERQRLALVRSVSTREKALERRKKELGPEELSGAVLHIDTFNTVIALETAFSGSVLLRGMDGAVRDLAGLRGTYRLIDKTDRALLAIRDVLVRCGVSGAVFYLDAPVSNSGRLKARAEQMMDGSGIDLSFHVTGDVDRILMQKPLVATADSVILDHCTAWFNLTACAVEYAIGTYPYVEFWEKETDWGIS